MDTDIHAAGTATPAPAPQAAATRLSGKRLLFKPIPRCHDNGCHADVYMPSDEHVDKAVKGDGVPIAVFLHGGAFGKGGSMNVAPDWVSYLVENGFMAVSLEYRLLPHADIDDMRTDVLDGYRWILRDLPTIIGGGKKPLRIAKSQVIVAGFSAGGALALYLGFDAVQNGLPAPRAIVPVYAVTKLDRPKAVAEDIIRQVDQAYDAAVQEESSACVPYARYPAEYPKRSAFLEGAFKHGIIDRYLLPQRQSVTSLPYDAVPPPHLSPFDMASQLPSAASQPKRSSKSLSSSGGSGPFPATAFIVATADSIVPPSNSHEMHEKLVAAGVPSQVFVAEGAKHGFSSKEDGKRGGKYWQQAVGPALDWAIGMTRMQYSK